MSYGITIFSYRLGEDRMPIVCYLYDGDETVACKGASTFVTVTYWFLLLHGLLYVLTKLDVKPVSKSVYRYPHICVTLQCVLIEQAATKAQCW